MSVAGSGVGGGGDKILMGPETAMREKIENPGKIVALRCQRTLKWHRWEHDSSIAITAGTRTSNASNKRQDRKTAVKSDCWLRAGGEDWVAGVENAVDILCSLCAPWPNPTIYLPLAHPMHQPAAE